MENSMADGDGILSKITLGSLREVMDRIEVVLRKRFAYKEYGNFILKHNEDGRLITVQGPLENIKEDEKYSIFVVKDNAEQK